MNGYQWFTFDGNPREISEAERTRPVHFEASTAKPHISWGEQVQQSNFPFYGFVPSLYIGTHAGWRVNGRDYPREVFQEHHFGGCFTGGAPVGLTPLVPLT